MLKIVILLVALTGALAEVRSQLRVTFDAANASPLNIKGRPFDLAYQGQRNAVYETGPVNEGLLFDGNYFLLARDSRTTDNCWTDLEKCDKGFTLSVWIKPTTPWQGDSGPEYIVSLGGGVEAQFGVKLAIRRRTLIPMALGRQLITRSECAIPEDYNPDAWMHIVIQRKQIDGPLLTFLNGIKMKCDSGDLLAAAKVTGETVNQIVVGAEQNPENGKFEWLYHGDVDDLEFFHKAIGIPAIRKIYRAGKDRVADIVAAAEAARAKPEGK